MKKIVIEITEEDAELMATKLDQLIELLETLLPLLDKEED